jgi:subtilisin family serine protease
MTRRPLAAAAGFAALLGACARAPAPAPAPERPAVAAAPAPQADTLKPPKRKQPVAPPQVASQLGLMPLASAGVTQWRQAHPAFDGRGVLIAVLDGGVDAGASGLQLTPAGDRKILDLRDFSDEGLVALQPVHADESGRIALPGGLTLTGGPTVAAAVASGEWFGGVLEELPFGNAPAADFNGNGSNRDRYGIVVVRTSSGWVAFVDANADGSLTDERPLADYLVRHETFTFASRYAARGEGPITAALNLSEERGRPRLVVYLDTSGHGSHVSGIAAGYTMYGVPGFNGVAPGARLIGLKIANDARGGVTTTGSMLRAMDYAVRFARERGLPLVINMSFGIGNVHPGRAVMDSIVNAFLIAHPDVFFAIAAGNDGPGTGTTGLPGSAELAVGVGATYPASMAAVQFGSPREALGWWSSRGGAVAKPDLVAPGLAYSTIPRWDVGNEVMGGTSMATPYVSGLAALLASAMQQEGRRWTGAQLLLALRASARPFPGEPAIDQGPGLPQIERAYTWLHEDHEAARYRVQPLDAAVVSPRGLQRTARTGGAVAPVERNAGGTAAYRPAGLVSGSDTLQRFRVSLVPEPGIAPRTRTFRLTSDATWLRPARASATLDSMTGSAVVDVLYDRAQLTLPGRYAGAVLATPERDSAAGPAFVLLNTVIVPDTASGGIKVTGRRLRGAAADRYYVRVPEGAAGLNVRLSVRDTTMTGTLNLFEPAARPARGQGSEDVGGAAGREAALHVAAEDVVPGVYEVVVQAMPGEGMTYDLTARAPSIRVDVSGDAVAIADAAPDTGAVVAVEQTGVAGEWRVSVDSGATVRRTVVAPPWARTAVLEVEVSPDVWDRVTDFALTLYDSLGAQLGNGAMNYPYHRVSADLPEHRPATYAVTWEMFPAFADTVPPAHIETRVRLRFEGEPRHLVAAQRLPADGRLMLPAPAPLESPEGMRALLLLRVGTPSDSAAVTQLLVR